MKIYEVLFFVWLILWLVLGSIVLYFYEIGNDMVIFIWGITIEAIFSMFMLIKLKNMKKKK
jgi:hypothetical protein